jgi:hypothetical protein
MLLIEAELKPEVRKGADGRIVLILRTLHPVSEKESDCLGVRFSVHHALFVSEQLRRSALAEMSGIGSSQ